ncbi:tyrosine-type recombinase/integrase [Bacillus sp. EB600]|uniref:tyrosine-type recombinase/integrase n=1 Tax=Bacillus sp. EB600 TaxID=2806345 RepID=UPI002109EF10|nr:tyrosine-type recombinase/integrase [Bacillus sp. EB600]MCQ6278757.1 tyrosine-type recombinase/integrase [Bacillus sp. EB600]
MARRTTVSTKVLEKLIIVQEQPVKNFKQASEEFLKHCRIKGLSDGTIKFYQKELKGLFVALIDRYARRVPMTKRLKTAYVSELGLLEETEALFVSVENAPINAWTVQERLKHYGVISKVEDLVPVSPHTFRRTFCRLKVEAGVNLFVLQRLTGHSDLEMLQRLDLEQAIEKGFE